MEDIVVAGYIYNDGYAVITANPAYCRSRDLFKKSVFSHDRLSFTFLGTAFFYYA
ncbi:hypothetical protein SDC9_153803 [bioreactor metagenome]|uniref:Uncharacterized protein n=1 Tax=bioreactor metagenome TaxID=1076179 RepID=A0A645EXB6_9ZZZZ